MPVNTAVRAVVRSPGKAAPLGVLCLRAGAFTLDDSFAFTRSSSPIAERTPLSPNSRMQRLNYFRDELHCVNGDHGRPG